MKKCPYCGREYPDDVERCSVDDVILPGVEVVAVHPGSATLAQSGEPAILPGSENFWTERRLLILEVLLVCMIAFGSAIITSSYRFLYGYSNLDSGTSSYGAFNWFSRFEREAAALGLVWFLLLRRNKTFKDLGLVWLWKDLGWTLLLIIAGSTAFSLVYDVIYHTGLTSANRYAASLNTGEILFGGGVYVATILFQFLNPFFEELIVRAYLMTQVKFFTHSAMAAILVSTILQTSYHFYQGAPSAIAHGASFLIFSIFYARTNRITPVILAHLYFDVTGTWWFLMNR
jgi:membrane protease YdiL (CAAX protease family)